MVEDRQRARRALRARLVVAADGRDSHLARMAGVRGRVRPHNRFFYWAYWRGVRPAGDRSRMWFMEPDCAYLFPNEDGLCLLLVAPHRDRLPEFKADLEGAYLRDLAALPDAPDLSQATRESKLLGKLDLPNVSRPAARPGLAFVGDAALASDPLWGVGCGWAFQSAEWLVEETAAALVGGGDLDAALDSYRRVHRRRLGPHHFLISDIASARPANPVERAMYRQAADRRRRLPHVRGDRVAPSVAGDAVRAAHAGAARAPRLTRTATRGYRAAGAWRPCRPRAPRSARGTRAPTSARSRGRTS